MLDETDHGWRECARDDRRARCAGGSRPPPPVALHVGEHKLLGVAEVEGEMACEASFTAMMDLPKDVIA